MSCCGNQRAQASTRRAQTGIAVIPQGEPSRATRITHVSFQYVGTTALTAMGAMTGTHYRFDWPGAVVAVDIRDQASLRSIPQLRPVYTAPPA